MTPPPRRLPPAGGQGPSAFKSRGGWRRVAAATGHSISGFRAAVRHEAAFRQELAIGIPLLALTPWLAPGRWQAVAMASSILLVLVVELLNSAVEAVGDAVSVDHHPMIERAKDLGSAAVMLSLLLAAGVWVAVLWP